MKEYLTTYGLLIDIDAIWREREAMQDERNMVNFIKNGG